MSARGREALFTAGIGLAAAVICVLRIPWALHDVAWAEDANVFLRDILIHGPWQSIGLGYAGYQHLVPRLLAGLVAVGVPLESYAVAVFFAGALAAGLVCAAVFHLSARTLTWLPARVLVGLLPVILPLAAQEVLGNLANLHTLALWLAFWILFSRPSSWASSIGWAAVMFLCAATEIQAIVLLGIVPFVVRRAGRRLWPPVVALALGGVWQLATFAATPRETAEYVMAPLSLPAGWLVNALMPMVNADPGSAGIWLDRTGYLVPLLALIPFALATAVSLVLGNVDRRVLAAAAAILSLLLYAASAWVNASPGLDYAGTTTPLSEHFLHMRYGVSAGLFLATTVPVAACVLRDHRGHRHLAVRVLAVTSVVGLAVVFVVSGTRSFPARSLVDAPWSAGVRQVTELCETAAAGREVALPVAPERVLVTACGELASYPRR